jgi:hypothetical protein
MAHLHVRDVLRLTMAVVLVCLAIVRVAPAEASGVQEAIFQDDTLLKSDPVHTLATLKELGVDRVRVLLTWASVAPEPSSRHRPAFNQSDPNAYPPGGWAVYDTIDRLARQHGIGVDFTLTSPVPLWAIGAGAPRTLQPVLTWKPNATDFKAFVEAVGRRYSGSFIPMGSATALPRVDFWAVWNEPNFGAHLSPQAIGNDTIEVGAVAYRSLLNAAWSALRLTGHRHDTILIGETAPRGLDHPIGNFSAVKPLRFLRGLYCVGSDYRPLRGAAAKARGCPTTAAGSRAFAAQNPALFHATGFADHPSAQSTPPNEPTTSDPRRYPRGDPDYADLPEIPRLERSLDKLNRLYGSPNRLPVYSTEYGYWTRPPSSFTQISAATAALYINWAEYISYKRPRLRSYAQYLLMDPVGGNYPSGLELYGARHKATYNAYRLPMFMPVTSARSTRRLELWGALRPTKYYPARGEIQFQRGSRGSFRTLRTVSGSGAEGYFDTRITFPASGTVRIAWTYPQTAPQTMAHVTVYSRSQKIVIT